MRYLSLGAAAGLACLGYEMSWPLLLPVALLCAFTGGVAWFGMSKPPALPVRPCGCWECVGPRWDVAEEAGRLQRSARQYVEREKSHARHDA